jgi:hypothetical protein
MTAIARRSLRTLVGIGVCVLTPTLLVSFRTSASSSLETSCAALHEWAQAYKGTSPSLDTFVPFDRPHRIAIFNAVTPDVRSALWREQLRRIARRSDLSDQQRDLINEAIGLATPAAYAHDSVARQAVVTHWTRAQQAFASGELRRLLFDLGGPTPSPSVRAAAPSPWDRMSAPFRADAQGAGPCYCSIMWQDCFWCVDGNCRWAFDGCGPYGLFECDGVCQYWQPPDTD